VRHIEYELRPDAKDDVRVLLEGLAEWGEAYLNRLARHTRDAPDTCLRNSMPSSSKRLPNPSLTSSSSRCSMRLLRSITVTGL
jgi:hypothetical protein